MNPGAQRAAAVGLGALHAWGVASGAPHARRVAGVALVAPRARRIAAVALFALLALAVLATAACALELPARPSGRVSDYANLLDASEKASLERRLAAFEDTTSSQIAVAIFPSLENESLEDFTNRLFAKWALGQAKSDNGVLLAIFVAERRARIEVGYGLEGTLTDAMSARILRERLTPAFKEGRYAAGIAAAAQGMEEATRGEFKADPRARRADREHSPLLTGLVGTFIAVIVLFLVIGSLGRNVYDSTSIGKTGARRRRRSFWDDWGGPFIGGTGGGGFGGWSSGGGGGGWSSGGGGGGFSGGGGSSGGGGASGSW